MRKVRGYIIARPLFGERVPQVVQNIVIRNYCHKHDLSYLLSKAEYSIEGSFSVLKNLLNGYLDGTATFFHGKSSGSSSLFFVGFI